MYILTLIAILLSTSLWAEDFSKAICGRHDDRVFSYDKKIGKVVKVPGSRIGCTATLIGKNCVITAGHCHNHFNFVEFNILHPNADGSRDPLNVHDIYQVDAESIKYKNIELLDWAIFKLLPNLDTGLMAGEAQGYYKVSKDKPKKRKKVTITGYGVEELYSDDAVLQKTHTAKIRKVSIFNHTITHLVDTLPGNSGSAIILEDSNEIIGIHTNNGCDSREKDNLGTLIYQNFQLNLAIKNCLK